MIFNRHKILTAPSEGVIFQARNVRVSFDSVEVLKGIDLTVRRGEVVAILGANGSGKSTLIRTLVGIQAPTSGTVTRPNPALIGFVPQRATSGGGISATALEVVASGLLGRHQLRLPRSWRQQALAALAQVGLVDRESAAVMHLSGGQQQRVYIARALVRHPDVLVLDEPLAGVDAASQQQLADLLAQLVKTGITVVVILHEIGALAPILTRVVVISEGQIVADVPPHAVPAIDHPDHAGVTGTQEDQISQIVAQLSEHKTGFPKLDPQLQGLSRHHRNLHLNSEGKP